MNERSPDTRSVSTAEPAALALTGITRRFGTVVALDDASLRVRRGSVHAVLGENGAGKTTLMRVAFGLLRPNAGTVEVRGRPAHFASPRDALAAGIGMVHQHFTLVPALTVAENVAMGGRGLFSVAEWADRVRAIGEETGLVLDPMARVEHLSVSAQQRCEIVKALARDVDLLILDEPTAVLAPDEARDLLRWMRSFADSGHSIVLITHKLRDAMAVADEMTVLRSGRTVFTALASATSQETLAAEMLGSGASPLAQPAAQAALAPTIDGAVAESTGTTNDATMDAFANANETPRSDNGVAQRSRTTATQDARAHSIATATLRAIGVSVHDARGVVRLDNVSLDVHTGEMLGIAAVEGAGQRELLRVLSGRMQPTSGQVTLPAQIGFVPEDRHHDALMLDASLIDNIALRDAGDRAGRMPWNALAETTADIILRRDVKAAGPRIEARTLSGGNQQKLILGRELANRPQALVVENPTRGLDFRATQSVHAALRAARDEGTAVVAYSSDLDEVLALADRVVVMHAGRISEVPNDRATIGRAMLGSRPEL